jgi:hypothetical protein
LIFHKTLDVKYLPGEGFFLGAGRGYERGGQA